MALPPPPPPPSLCHILPCRMDYSGPAAVDVYFMPHPLGADRERRSHTAAATARAEDGAAAAATSPSITEAEPTQERDLAPPAPARGHQLPQYQAAQFRGRGLLATYPAEPVTALALTLQDDERGAERGDDRELASRAVVRQSKLDGIVEWHHEHRPAVVGHFHRHLGRGRATRGLEWCRTAAALHEPLGPASSAPAANGGGS